MLNIPPSEVIDIFRSAWYHNHKISDNVDQCPLNGVLEPVHVSVCAMTG